ncbi:MAG: TonB family protein [Rubrivivax sp.]|nr:TonB family protein [Pyrinomonadaceae bacterium]
MKATRPFLLLYVVGLLYVSAMLPTGARTQGVSGSGSIAKAVRYHALVIGNNMYKNIPRLKTAENDARAVEAILRENYGFQTKLLLNATRQQIFTALSQYRRELEADSNLVIYYAGHGINDKETDKAYWLPVDATREDNSNWISADDITSNIKAIPAKHVLIVSDSCYSGTLTRGLDMTPSVPAGRERYLEKMMAKRSRMLMASGGNEPVADSGGAGNHSVFASALLRGLQQTEKHQFTAGELYREYVEESVAGRANQTPQYNYVGASGHDGGDFVFVRVKTADGKTIEVTVKTPAAGAVDPAAVELSFWETIKNSTDPEDFKAYLKKYPSGQFADLARRRAEPPRSRPEPTRAEPARDEPESAPTNNASDEDASDTSEEDEPEPNSATQGRTISGGNLNGKAISKPQPDYPPMAKAARAQGTVNVQVVIDERGRVISARAVSGHPLLQPAAAAAARQAMFSPLLLSGKPVKVSGILTYNFTLP